MNPTPIKTTNANWRTGVREKLKPKSYSLVYRNGVTVVHDRPYGYVLKIKNTQHPNAEIKPNY